MESNTSNNRDNLPFDVNILKTFAVVKVFVIDKSDGNWLDCGAGDAQFTIRSKVPLELAQKKDIGIRVRSSGDLKEQIRDEVDKIRMESMGQNSEDPNLILEVNFEHSADFSKCQSSLLLL